MQSYLPKVENAFSVPIFVENHVTVSAEQIIIRLRLCKIGLNPELNAEYGQPHRELLPHISGESQRTVALSCVEQG